MIENEFTEVDTDVLVIGGGAAGLAAATSLARFRHRVAVVDAGQPRNASADGVHNYLSRDGLPPAELVAAGRRELRGYGGQIIDGAVTAVRHATPGAVSAPRFTVELAGGGTLTARRVLVASGLVDELPNITGLAVRWGRDVLHCPYCHGWEVRDQRLAVLATSAVALHAVLLWRQLSERLTVVLDPGVEPSEQQWERFAARGVEVVIGPVEEVVVAGDRLTGMRLAGGHVVNCDALAISNTLHARVGFLEPLGLVPVPFMMGETVVGSRLEAGPTGATAVPGVYAAGNATDLFAQVAGSVAAALTVAAAVNSSLIEEDADLAVRSATAPLEEESVFSAAAERQVCEQVLGDRRHGL
ncbi:NAD(P)/FAD-dependent oxidoreductase [Actinoplanes couchii]|nr:NAD(P)/FAD-dependent oxidoreductase [Actinoplanes couchii]MDR6318807.1 thioredoxin reductase (NADPH) [Actinoplanes couchii]